MSILVDSEPQGIRFSMVPLIELQIPLDSDWVERGIVLSAGPPGSWDSRLVGSLTPTAMIKKAGTYFLYYIGASGNIGQNWGPHRALGVATSTDGVHFTKYNGNPVITYSPHNNIEEGIFSATATLDENGNITMYVAALTSPSQTSPEVHSDIRLYVSTDGYNFTDLGVVVSYSDGGVWGSGDELFPVGVFRTNQGYFVYYIAEGGVANWDLGLAWGPNKNSLPNTIAALVSPYSNRPASAVAITISNDQHAIFLQYRTQEKMDVRTIYDNAPADLSNLARTYQVEGAWCVEAGNILTASTVFFDIETNTWFLYHMSSDGDAIKAKTAPAKL